jgi:hypothetical protein
MLSNLSFEHSRFILNYPYTLPLIIPPSCYDAVVFSLKTESIYDNQIYVWNPKKQIFMLNILFYWDEISEVFTTIEKSKIYNSQFAEVYCFTMKRSFINKFSNLKEAIASARILLELTIKKANEIIICQMNYLTVYSYLEKIEVYDLLLSD